MSLSLLILAMMMMIGNDFPALTFFSNWNQHTVLINFDRKFITLCYWNWIIEYLSARAAERPVMIVIGCLILVLSRRHHDHGP